jgi:hypothetical protein
MRDGVQAIWLQATTRSKRRPAAFCKCFMGRDFATVADESVLKRGAFGFDMYRSRRFIVNVFAFVITDSENLTVTSPWQAALFRKVNLAPAHWRISCFVDALLRKLRAVYERLRFKKIAE